MPPCRCKARGCHVYNRADSVSRKTILNNPLQPRHSVNAKSNTATKIADFQMDRPPQQHVTHQVSDLPEGQKRLPSPPESNCPQPGRAGRTSDSPPSIHVAHHTSPTSPSRLTSNQAGRSKKNGPKRRGRHMVSCAGMADTCLTAFHHPASY